MKKQILLVSLILSCLFAKAQEVAEYQLFNKINNYTVSEQKLTNTNYAIFELDQRNLDKLNMENHEELEFQVTIDNQARTIYLKQHDIFAPDFYLEYSSGEKDASVTQLGKHYKGYIRGEKSSLVAFSIFNDHVMGLISLGKETYTLGKIENEAKYILYNDSKALPLQHLLDCKMSDDGLMDVSDPLNKNFLPSGKCVRVFVESAYDIYQNKGANTTLYLTGLFNQSAVLYDNESIPIVLSQLFIWTTPSPYNGTSSFARLAQFQNNRTSFNGDVAHLVDYGTYGGVADGVNAFCGTTANKMCYSGIQSTYNNVPTYSWSVYVFTHEMGHLFGSRHTHACVWNGNNTAIDGCKGSVEGSCSLPGIPSGGGTIMSYCHWQSVGINLNLGFGPQPGNLIRNRINNATCLTSCCIEDIVITGSYYAPVTESSTWIKTNGTTTIQSNVTVKLDANPTSGYIELNPGFTAAPASGYSFVAQAYNGCTSGTPMRPNTEEENDASEAFTSKNEFSLYPNPSSDVITIQNNNQDVNKVSITITSIDGKVVKQITNQNIDKSITIDVKSLLSGLYIVTISASNEVKTIKFQKL